MYSPTQTEFLNLKLAEQGNVIPVTRRLLADFETPLSVYRKIRGQGESFLLESVEGGEHVGRYSFVAVGTDRALQESFGSVCHGAGRRKSRHAAKRGVRDEDVARDLAARGILAIAASRGGLAEESSDAYKDVAEVVGAVDGAGLARKVARLRPMAVIKG